MARIERYELRKIARPGAKVEAAAPAGILPILRASWQFARDMAKRFSQELNADHSEEFLKNLPKKF